MAFLNEVIEVAHVIRAKHDKVPACFADCKENGVKVFDLSKEALPRIGACRIPLGRAGSTDRAR